MTLHIKNGMRDQAPNAICSVRQHSDVIASSFHSYRGLRYIRSAPLKDLETLLHAVQSLQNLPPLVAALGHQPLWEEVPAEVWPWPARVTVIGRTAELPWFAIESPAPQRDAILFAKRLSRRGRVAIVLALDPVQKHLSIALALPGQPHLHIRLADPGAEAIASLSRLSGAPEGGTLAFAAKAADALTSQTVSSRFFRVFRSTLDRMAAGLPGPMSATDRHALALLQLTRVLFLYFIQSKGWLAGRDRFLIEQIDGCLSRRRNVQRDLLRPLFFGTLNQPRASRGRTATGFGNIPFLNGGLFEPHSLERRHRTELPNELWRDAFDLLFERFHFTLTEGQADGRVAPDMLGRVFEGVMDPDQRRASGTFYTPASLRLWDTRRCPGSVAGPKAPLHRRTRGEAAGGWRPRDPENSRLAEHPGSRRGIGGVSPGLPRTAGRTWSST